MPGVYGRPSLPARLGSRTTGTSIAVKDFRGKPRSLRKPAERIVRLIESALSGLYMLGAEARIVGISANVYEDEAFRYYAAMDERIREKKLSAPGNWDFINIEKVVGLKPDLVIIWAHQKEAIRALDERGIPVYGIFIRTFQDVSREMLAFGELTGRASYVSLIPGETDREMVLKALESVGISHLRSRPFTELSGGEQQLVMIARVLAQEPRLILLDEPATHLDFLNQARLLRLIMEFVDAELAVVAVLHDPNLAFLYGDRFIFLQDGQAETWHSSQKPWDPEILTRVYDGAGVCSISYRDRALVIPGFDLQ